MLTQHQILATYRAQAAQVEAQHAAGQISGAERRERLLAVSQDLRISPQAGVNLNHLIRAAGHADRLDEARKASRREWHRRRREARQDTTNTTAA